MSQFWAFRQVVKIQSASRNKTERDNHFPLPREGLRRTFRTITSELIFYIFQIGEPFPIDWC